MKILQVTAVDFSVKKFLLPLVDHLRQYEFDVHIACHASETGAELASQGYRIHHVPFARNFNGLQHTKALARMVQLLRQEKYDIVHAHTPVASLIVRLAAKITGAPLTVYTAHGFYFHENMRPAVYKAAYTLERIWGKYLTDYLFFQSEEDYQLALANQFNRPDRLVHINNGVSGERFNPAIYNRDQIRAELGLADEKVVLFVGRMVREKGILELLSAFAELHKRHDHLRLLLVGGYVTGDRDGIDPKQIIEEVGLEADSAVRLLGLRNDIPELISASDLFVLPSYREGLPRSIIEAMAMGKPIVATDIRGCREEVVPGVNGELCKDRNAHALADCLESVLLDDEKMVRYGEQSRRLFLEKFDEQRVLERQLVVFQGYREQVALQKGVQVHV